MNIYGHVKKAIYELENHIFNLQEVDNICVLEGIKKSWEYLQKYIKNIYPEFTKFFQENIEKLEVNEILITKDMIEEAHTTFKRMKKERIDVKIFMQRYIWVINVLLIFNKPFEESCDMCQGHLFYYYNETHVIKICRTCSMSFMLNGEVISPKNLSSNLRPAKKNELLKVL
ncbi:hypothetical protein WMW72_24690 [Paenibacillus filicis]|uniref:Uncharacterized protein n=1 Tax=Paenibacillus filicis TaxID=669464 RepID=A0ABU9DQG4_9BACL